MHFGGGVGSREIVINDLASYDSGVGLIALGGTDDGIVTVANSTFYVGNEKRLNDTEQSFIYKTEAVWLPFFGKHATSV